MWKFVLKMSKSTLVQLVYKEIMKQPIVVSKSFIKPSNQSKDLHLHWSLPSFCFLPASVTGWVKCPHSDCCNLYPNTEHQTWIKMFHSQYPVGFFLPSQAEATSLALTQRLAFFLLAALQTFSSQHMTPSKATQQTLLSKVKCSPALNSKHLNSKIIPRCLNLH